MIDGVLIQPLKVLGDERGKVMHMVRQDSGFFEQFGEVYFSMVNAGIVKGWKKHLKMTQHIAVPVGNIKLVLYDDREGSPTKGRIQEIESGEDNYRLVRVPPLVWYAFGATGAEAALIANCTDLVHDPKEIIRIDLSDERIPYEWGIKNA
jgi:dTDP-4-dehydrorhamnose 3,5-epimerase